MTRIYKLLERTEWSAAVARGLYDGSAIDLADGFIHFSTAEQLGETARRHFAGHPDLVCVSVEADTLQTLRWEPSRGGALFPHLYGPLDPSLIVAISSAPLGDDGVPVVEPDRA